MEEKEKYLEQLDIDRILQNAIRRSEEDTGIADDSHSIAIMMNRMMDLARLRALICPGQF